MKAPLQIGSWQHVLRGVFLVIAAGAATVSAMAMRIVLTNDDGFETRNIQALFTALKAAGHEVILSAPYRDQSGTSAMLGGISESSRTSTPSQSGLIAAGAPPVGPTTIAADQYYIDGSPATAAVYGVEVLARAKWAAGPDLVVSGPNVGNNLGTVIPHSGTVGAAVTMLNRGIPAIAVSGANGTAATANLLAAITLRVIAAIEANGRITLPPGVGLNVNIPVLDPTRSPASYRFAFTQVGAGAGSETTAFAEGNTVTVSPIQGTYQAPPELAVLALAQMRELFSATLAIPNPKLTNLSVRGFVGAGSAVQIAGFVVSGNSTKTILIRASGLALASFGVLGALADPYVELYDRDNRLIATNDNWSDDEVKATAIATAAARVGAFPWTTGTKDAAVLVTLAPGLYTVVIRGSGNTTGVALIETYDINVD